MIFAMFWPKNCNFIPPGCPLQFYICLIPFWLQFLNWCKKLRESAASAKLLSIVRIFRHLVTLLFNFTSLWFHLYIRHQEKFWIEIIFIFPGSLDQYSIYVFRKSGFCGGMLLFLFNSLHKVPPPALPFGEDIISQMCLICAISK